jgi:hypothetical protein
MVTFEASPCTMDAEKGVTGNGVLVVGEYTDSLF